MTYALQERCALPVPKALNRVSIPGPHALQSVMLALDRCGLRNDESFGIHFSHISNIRPRKLVEILQQLLVILLTDSNNRIIPVRSRGAVSQIHNSDLWWSDFAADLHGLGEPLSREAQHGRCRHGPSGRSLLWCSSRRSHPSRQ